jgi:hypothetical protein
LVAKVAWPDDAPTTFAARRLQDAAATAIEYKVRIQRQTPDYEIEAMENRGIR